MYRQMPAFLVNITYKNMSVSERQNRGRNLKFNNRFQRIF